VSVVLCGLGVAVILERMEGKAELSALAATAPAQLWWRVIQYNSHFMPMSLGASVLFIALPVMRLQEHAEAARQRGAGGAPGAKKDK